MGRFRRGGGALPSRKKESLSHCIADQNLEEVIRYASRVPLLGTIWDDMAKSYLLLQYRVLQMNFTPEIEVFYRLFDRYLSIFSMTSLKQHMHYFHILCKIQMDLPVRILSRVHIFFVHVVLYDMLIKPRNYNWFFCGCK